MERVVDPGVVGVVSVRRLQVVAFRFVRVIAFLLATFIQPAWAQEQLSLFETAERTVDGTLIVTADESAVRELGRLPAAFIDDFPTSSTHVVTLRLERFNPVADDAVITFSDGTIDTFPVPDDLAYFTGRVEGEPTSAVFLIVSGDTVRGFVTRGSAVIAFRPPEPQRFGGGASWPDATVFDQPLDAGDEDVSACPIGHFEPEPIDAFAALSPTEERGFGAGGSAGLTGAPRRGWLEAPMAVEVTPEVAEAFGTQEELIKYVISLVAVASLPYRRDATDTETRAGVSLRLAHLNIMLESEDRDCDGLAVGKTHCSGSGEFCLNDSMCAWDETCITPDYLPRAECFRDHWMQHFPDAKFHRAFAVQLWRAPADGTGGYALHAGSLCRDDSSYAWAIIRSDPRRSLRPRVPEDPFFASVLAHEIGHLFGAQHPECVGSPTPLEICRNDDISNEWCWDGPTADSPGGATVMSTFGCSTIATPLTFVPRGPVRVPGVGTNPFPDRRTAETVRQHADAAACIVECVGEDADADSVPDACDLDDDNDGALDTDDPDPLHPDVCGSLDGDACDDCDIGTDDFGPHNDRLPYYDGPDADCDGVCDDSDETPRCVGDCDFDCQVFVDEIVRVVSIGLGHRPMSECSAADSNADKAVTVDETVQAVISAIRGCGQQ